MKDLLLETIRSAGKAGLARALARIERSPEAPEVVELLDNAWADARAHVVGVTGPPGVGKSTLAGVLIHRLRMQGHSVAVIAVDPSSRRSGGALLGDRVRLLSDPSDPHLFVRSMAARDRLGGLAGLTWSAAILMRALFDHVIVETVGVGQSETDVTSLADSVVFCVQPGSGDSLQFMKAGIVETPDVAVVTKADRGVLADRALEDLRAALALVEAEEGWPVECMTCSAESGDGLEELARALERHKAWLAEEGRLEQRRRRQAEEWLRACVLEDWGHRGLAALAEPLSLKGDRPFEQRAILNESLKR